MLVKSAKLFANGSSQAVRLPKEFRFDTDEIGVTRMGEIVLLYPMNRSDELFFSSLGTFTDDFYVSIERARAEEIPDVPREIL